MNCAVQLDYQRARAFPWAGVLLLVLALAMLAWAAAYYVELRGMAEKWEARVLQIEQRQPGWRKEQASRAELQGVTQETRRANEVLRRLTLPWDRLFEAVEAASGKEVALLAIDPDLEKKVVKISGEAKNLAAALAYVQRLERQEMFGTVYLQSHQVQRLDPEKPVRFSLLGMLGRKP
jgi:hypothetical protein